MESRMNPSNEVVPLASPHREQVAEALTCAFQPDPLYTYAFPDPERRTRMMRMLWRALVKYTLLYGDGYTTPDVKGVACWLPPGDTVMTAWRTLRSGLWIMPVRAGREERRRFFGVLGHLDEIHKRTMSIPHWYLLLLGVDPDLQGQGVGGKLIAPVLARADDERLPCYLETQTERNVRFYRKHGFEVATEGKIPGHGVMAWTMIREPI